MVIRTIEEHQKVVELRKRGLGRYEIARVTGIPLGTVGSWLRGTEPGMCLNKSREILIKNLRLAHSKLEKSRTKRLIELSNKVTTEFAYVLGAVLGDGYIYFNPNGGCHVRLSVKDRDFAQTFYNYLKNWSKVNCRIYKYRGFWRVYCCSVVVAKFLKNFDLNEMASIPEDVICSFLKGLFDAEGNISRKRVRFYNSDINLINLVRDLLENVGIENIKVFKRKKEIHSFGDRKHLVKAVYCLSISRKKNIELFNKKIGFSIKRKQAKLEKELQSYQRIHNFWIKEELEFLKKNSHRNYHWVAKQLGGLQGR